MAKHVLRGEMVGMVLDLLMSKLSVGCINNTYNPALVREHIITNTVKHLIIEEDVDVDTVSPVVEYLHDLIDPHGKPGMIFTYLEMLEHIMRGELSRIPYADMTDIDIEVDLNGFIIITAN